MIKSEFLSQLEKKLSNLPQEEMENAVIYYSEYFDDAGQQNEQYVIQELGSPSKVASQIIANYTINNVETYPKSMKKGISNVGRIIGAIFASTIAIPVAISIAALAFALVLAVLCFILSFAIMTFTFITTGVFLMGISLSLIFKDIATAILVIGTAFILLGLGISTYVLTTQFTKKGFGWIATSISKILLRREKYE